MFDYEGIQFLWMGHDGFQIIGHNKKTIYIDPFQIQKTEHNKNDADIVLISHNHFDHLSMEDLKHVLGQKTIIVAANECIKQLMENFKNIEIKGVAPGDRLSVQGVPIEAGGA